MIYDKLVRDKIPEILESKGIKAYFRSLDEAEYKEYLEKKLDEEVAEFHKSKSIEELADILDVIEALCNLAGTTDDMIWAQGRKYIERGGFEKRICLVEIEEEREDAES